MLAIILAGGKGTRLKPFTATIPKPLLPIGDIPILEVVVRQLVASGFTRIALTLNHMAQIFTSVMGDGSQWGVSIEHYIEDAPLGTAGSIRLVDNLEENFLVMNGDLLTDIDYRTLFDYHVKQNAYGTIGSAVRSQYIDFGVIETDEEGQLKEFREKPSTEYRVSMGINILNKKCLDYIPRDRKFDMPDLMVNMRQDGKPVYCYPFKGYWQDIGRVDDFQKAGEDFTNNPDKFLPKINQ